MGVVLYEALTGQKPFVGDSFVAVARAAVEGEHQPLLELRPDVDPSVAAAVERAMDPEPSRRFESAEAMAAALTGQTTAGVAPTRVLAGAAPDPSRDDTAPLTATHLAPGPPLPLVPARRRRRLLVPLLATAAALALLVGLLVSRGGEPSPSPASTPATATTAAPATLLVPTTVPQVSVRVTNPPTVPKGRKGRRGNNRD